MRSTIGLFSVCVLFVAGCSTTPGAAQTAPPEPVAEVAEGATIMDGIFTAAQADRGQRLATANCFGCHSQNEWANPMFLSVYSSRPVGVLVSNIQATMPYDSPGRLSRQEYTDIVTYMLRLNRVPAGDTELPPDEAAQAAIMMVPMTN
jgi:mono/diheme cytochrome c family protein